MNSIKLGSEKLSGSRAARLCVCFDVEASLSLRIAHENTDSRRSKAAHSFRAAVDICFANLNL